MVWKMSGRCGSNLNASVLCRRMVDGGSRSQEMAARSTVQTVAHNPLWSVLVDLQWCSSGPAQPISIPGCQAGIFSS